MALKPTIYKTRIDLSDLDRNYYDTLNLTIAQHPSETPERMVARVLAFCLNAQEGLSFTKGLSEIEEPDMWVRKLDDTTSLWIEVGEPEVDRIKKATRKADTVKVYSFNTKSDHWWEQRKGKFSFLDVDVIRLDTQSVQTLAGSLTRSIDWSITISGQSLYVLSGADTVEVVFDLLQVQN